MRKQLNSDLQVFYEFWEADNEAKAVVLLVHGMAEHIKRYQNFSTFLNKSDYHVYGYDQRGHGQTAGSLDEIGFFAAENGWEKVVNDVKDMITFIKSQHDLPIILMGHSMGSFISRDFVNTYSDMVDGLILSGTGYKAGIKSKFLIGFGQVQMAMKGVRYPSKSIDKITGFVLNSKFRPLRTPFDWLNRDEIEVDKYIDDPYCGSVFSTSFYVSLHKSVERINHLKALSGLRKDLPIYIFSGDEDPVGDNGKGVRQVYSLYKSHGMDNVSIRLYRGGRHEMLNEKNKDEVYNHVLEWLDKTI